MTEPTDQCVVNGRSSGVGDDFHSPALCDGSPAGEIAPAGRYEVFVHGLPKGQPRTKSRALRLPGGRIVTRHYTPASGADWREDVRAAVARLAPVTLTGPVDVAAVFYLPRPKSHFRKNGLRPDVPRYLTGKPDLDNAAKLVLDAMTSIGCWLDDAQVARLEVAKVYHVPEEPCGMWLRWGPLSK